VINCHAWNFILTRELPFWPTKWSGVSGVNKQRTADRHVYSSIIIIWLDRPIFGHQLDRRFDERLATNCLWKNGYWNDLQSGPKVDQFDQPSNVLEKTGPQSPGVSGLNAPSCDSLLRSANCFVQYQALYNANYCDTHKGMAKPSWSNLV